MRRSNGHHGTMQGYCAAGCGVLLAMLLSSAAFGHFMAVTRGTAVVEGQSLTVMLVAGGEDLFHTQDLRPDSDGTFAVEEIRRATAAHGESLLGSIMVRDAHGEPIGGRVESWKIDAPNTGKVEFDGLRALQMRYTLRYDLSHAGAYVSFQHRVEGRGAMFLSSIVLDIRGVIPDPRTVQLTSGGNVEVVRLDPTKRRDSSSDSSDVSTEAQDCNALAFVATDALQTIRALVHINDKGVRSELFLPIGILQTWQPIPRAQRDFLEVAEQQRSREWIARLVQGHNSLAINGNLVEGRVAAIDFLDVGETGHPLARPPRRLSALTARVRVAMEYQSSEPPRDLDLHWTLFNPAILTAHALILVDNQCSEQDISTYDPHLRWTRE